MVMKDDCRWWAQNIRIMYHRNLYLKPTVFCHLKCVFCPNFLGKNMHVHYTWVNDYTPWGQQRHNNPVYNAHKIRVGPTHGKIRNVRIIFLCLEKTGVQLFLPQITELNKHLGPLHWSTPPAPREHELKRNEGPQHTG